MKARIIRTAADVPSQSRIAYKWIALSNTIICMLMATVNATSILIAMPVIFRGIHINPLDPANFSYLLWLLMGYMVVSAVLVVTAGRLGGMYGRTRVYNIGFVGIHPTRRGNRYEALDPLRQGIRVAFGSYSQRVALGLKVRHDHGSQIMSDDYQKELDSWASNPAPPTSVEPEGNGVAERFVRTIKGATAMGALLRQHRRAATRVVRVQREVQPPWILEKHRYRTPARVRADFAAEAVARTGLGQVL